GPAGIRGPDGRDGARGGAGAGRGRRGAYRLRSAAGGARRRLLAGATDRRRWIRFSRGGDPAASPAVPTRAGTDPVDRSLKGGFPSPMAVHSTKQPAAEAAADGRKAMQERALEHLKGLALDSILDSPEPLRTADI